VIGPQDIMSSLGDKIRQLRKVKGYTLTQVAELAACTPSYLSQIEHDKTSPSIASLKRIATALGARIVDFFLDDDESGEPVVYEPDQWLRISLPRWKADIRQMVRGVKQRQMQPFFTTIEPGGGTKEEYWHTGEEFGLVLEGELSLKVGSTVYNVKQGSSFYYSSVMSHSWVNEGEKTCKVIWVVNPPSW
jgi:transcriptional regulator with XRE-family HTH domain